MDFIAAHRGEYGVEPICTVLTEHGCPIAPSTYYAFLAKMPSRRELRDAELIELITTVRKRKFVARLGARKLWLHLRRKGHDVARCTVERLMTQMGITGATRSRKPVTTRPDETHTRPADLVDRQFWAPAPDRLWVADFERHEAFANPSDGGRPSRDACRSRRLEAGGRSTASAWRWSVEQSSTTTSRSRTAR